MADATVGRLRGPLRSANGAITGAGPSRAARTLKSMVPVGVDGAFKLSGTVSISGTPLAGYKVWAYPFKFPCQPIAAKITSSDGAFLFEGVASGRYIILAFNPSGDPNGRVYVNVDAVAM